MSQPPSDETKLILEQNQRYSQSLLWELQRTYFNDEGVRAWSEVTVPFYITSNPFIAHTQAQLALNFFRDWGAGHELSPIDPDQPLYIVELGTGSGRFSYHFLKQFVTLRRKMGLEGLNVTYVMTDFAERNVAYWLEHPALQPLIETELLDFARFDALHDDALNLVVANQRLSAGAVANPMVIIGNYFFDSIPIDVFRLAGSDLYESRVTLSAQLAEGEPIELPDLTDPALLDRITCTFSEVPVDGPYYDNATWNDILEHYQSILANTYLRFPAAGLRCCDLFRTMSEDRLLLLAADKGYIHQEELLGQEPPGLAVHGSFSMKVDFYAFRRYFEAHDGRAVFSHHTHENLLLAAFLLGQPEGRYRHTRHCFADTVPSFSPNEFYAVRKLMTQDVATLTWPEMMGLLRWSRYDANVLDQFLETLIERASDLADWQQRELTEAVGRVWELYYHLDEADDLPFSLGVLLFEMGDYETALLYYQHSINLNGDRPDTLFNIGLCHYYRQAVETALSYVRQTLELEPAHESALALYEALQPNLET